MVFSSAPAYLNPSIWQPQLTCSQIPEHGSGPESTQVPPLLLPPPPIIVGVGTGKTSTMSDRATLAKLPLPEVAVKCPRCESTNTKFCYFNNYNLSQPRHFCKTCRRYWTRGGALRNIPVGGGCRRNNKKSKSGKRSKSPATNSPSIGPSRCKTDNINHLDLLPPPKLPFLPSLQHLTDYGAGPAAGLTFGNIQQASSTVGNDVDLINVGSDYSQWKMHPPFPFSEGPTTGLYQIERDGNALNYVTGGVTGNYFGCMTVDSGVNQVDGGINMEENPHGLNLSKRFMGISGADNQLWGISNPWSNASSSSSTNNELQSSLIPRSFDMVCDFLPSS